MAAHCLLYIYESRPFFQPKEPTFAITKTHIPALSSAMSTPPPPATGDAVPGLSVSVTGKIMVVSVLFVFFLVAFFLILYLRVNRFLGANPTLVSFPVGVGGGSTGAVTSRRALDPAVIKLLPVIVFSSADFKDGMECAVCLSELADGESARLLPRCRHGFHLECIDMWFGSNSTCPICRSSVEPPFPPSAKNVILATENSAFPPEMTMPADCLGEGSSSSDISDPKKPSVQIMAIDIPGTALESSTSALQSSRIPEAEEMKPPNLGSFRSLRRMLGSACSQRGWDIEHGPAVAGGESGESGSSSSKNSQRD